MVSDAVQEETSLPAPCGMGPSPESAELAFVGSLDTLDHRASMHAALQSRHGTRYRHANVVELKTSSVLLTNERAIDTSEVCSSASLSFHLWRSPPAPFFDSPTPPCRVRWALATSFHSFLTPRTPTPPRATPRWCVRARF